MISKKYHFLSALTCAMLMLPFGIIATALVPIMMGFTKEIYLQVTRRNGSADNLSWVIYGSSACVMIAESFQKVF